MSKILPPPRVQNLTNAPRVECPSASELHHQARRLSIEQRQHTRNHGGLHVDRAHRPYVDPARAALRRHVQLIVDTAEKAGQPLHRDEKIDLNRAIGEAMGLSIDEQAMRIDYKMFADSTAPRSRTQEATQLTREMRAPNSLIDVFPTRAVALEKDQYADLYQSTAGKAAPIRPGQTDVPTVSYELGEDLHKMHWIGAATRQDWYYQLVGNAPGSVVDKAFEETQLAIQSINEVYDDGLREGLAGLDFRGVGQLECNVVVSKLDWTTATIDQKITETIRLIGEAVKRNGKAGEYSVAHFDWDVEDQLAQTSNLGAGGNSTGIDDVLAAMRKRRVGQMFVHPKGLGPSPFGGDRRRILLTMPGAVTRPVSFAPAPVYTGDHMGRYTIFAGCFGGLSLAQRLGACILDLKVI